MPPVHFTTTDLYLAAYLMYCGAEIVGITKLTHNSSTVTLSKRGILSLVNDYNSYRAVRYSPRAFAETRDHLKRIIKSQPTT